MNKSVLAILMMLFSLASFGSVNPQSGTSDDSWVLDTTIQNVSFYHKLISCNGKTAVLLKFDNKNASAATINWSESFSVSEVSGSLSGAAGEKQLKATAGITAASGCTEANSALRILATDVNPTFIATITGFRFSNVSVSLTN